MLEIPPTIVEAAIDEGIEAERLVAPTPAPTARCWSTWRPCMPVREAARREPDRPGRRAASLPADRRRQGHRRGSRGKMGLHLAAQPSEQAMALAVPAKVMVITGGPGVGKTTIMNAIVKIFAGQEAEGRAVGAHRPGRQAHGRDHAAWRPRPSTGCWSFDPGHGRFKHNAENPLDGDVFIVDESSMIDLVLAMAARPGHPPHAALILVGDVDQLPSVGPGCVLRDIIDSGASARLPADRGLPPGRPQRHRHQRPPRSTRARCPRSPAAKQEEARTARTSTSSRSADPDRAVDMVVAAGPRSASPSGSASTRSTTSRCSRPCSGATWAAGTSTQVLQAALNPTGPAVQRYGWTFRVGDKVMQTVNDYDKDVFNGDIGRIAEDRRGGAGDDRPLRRTAGEVRLQRAGRAAPVLRHDRPQEPGQRIPRGGPCPSTRSTT